MAFDNEEHSSGSEGSHSSESEGSEANTPHPPSVLGKRTRGEISGSSSDYLGKRSAAFRLTFSSLHDDTDVEHLLIFRGRTDPLVHHGRHFGRTVHAFCHMITLLSEGLIRSDAIASGRLQLSALSSELRYFILRQNHIADWTSS
jgi:hypothetical protein